jgi:lysophospholipase L1-like esterase
MYLPYTANQGSNFPVAPDALADKSRGFSVGYEWFDFVAGRTYVCVDNSYQAAVWVSSKGMDNVRSLLQTIDRAIENNPYQKAVATGVTVAVSSTSDGTLGPIVQMANGTALSTAAQTKVAFYGGNPEITGGAYVRMPVTSTLPAVAGNAGGSNNAWSNAVEVNTDATVIEFCVFTNSSKKVMFQVDGQYVDFTGSVSLSGTNADSLFKLTFASRKVRRVRVLLGTTNAAGTSMLKFIRVSPGCSFWKPSQAHVKRVGWFGDSYSEGTNGAVTVHPIPNASWPVLTGELLGLRDVRQLAVGGSGYLATLSGTRSKFRDQIPWSVAHGPFDLLVVAHGYNDTANTAQAVADEATLCYKLLRSQYPNVPIVVQGVQAGAAGPSAAQTGVEAALAGVVTGLNDPLIKFVKVSTDDTTWLNGTGKVGATNGTGNSDVYVDPDGIHPTLVGQEYLAFRSASGIRNAVASMLI